MGCVIFYLRFTRTRLNKPALNGVNEPALNGVNEPALNVVKGGRCDIFAELFTVKSTFLDRH